MTPDDPKRTVPREPVAPADGSHPRSARSTADNNRTTDHRPQDTPGTIARTPAEVERSEQSARELISEVVPGYVLLRELGRGGMGVVYEARHINLNRVVALKMILGREQAHPDELTRFLAEAESVAAVRHENVVQVYDYGESHGRPYMVLEFCPGGTITRLLPKAPESATDPRAMAELISAVARGVAAAHAVGIVHRDLKPGNVFLDADGTPKVADFGLAKRGEGMDVTRTGVGMGTPAYMAPEQARDAKFVGPPADVWALGVMLYEALTGTRPFTGTSAVELLLKIEMDAPVPPRSVVPAVPRDLELICLKCLDKDPQKRYPTAEELADDLDRYLTGRPISVRPTGPVERAYKWARRNKVATAALFAATLAVVVGGGLLVALKEANTEGAKRKAAEEGAARIERERLAELARRKAAEITSIKAKGESDEQRQKREKAEGRVRDVQYFDQLLRAAQLRFDDPQQGVKLLTDPAHCPPDRREIVWNVLHRFCRREYLTLPDLGATALAAAPDSKTLAVGTRGAKALVRVLDVTTGKEIRALPGHTADVTAVTFASAGKVLASADAAGTIRVWDAESGKPGRVLTGWPGGVRALALSPDGRWLAAGCGGHPLVDKAPADIKVWDLQKEGAATVLGGHTGPVWALAFNAAGDALASCAPDGTVRLWDVTPARHRQTLQHSGWVACVAFSPDGKKVVAGNADGVIRVWSTADGKRANEWNGMAAGAYGAAFAPDGTALATAHEGGAIGVMQVKIWNPDTGKQLYALDMGKGRVDALAYTPDGNVLAAADQNGAVRFWRMKLTDEDVSVPAHARGYAVAWSPDGGTIASGGGFPLGGDVRLWDAKTGEPRGAAWPHKGRVLALAYSPDGGTLAVAGDNGELKLLNATTGTGPAVAAHAKAVRCLAFAPDGATVATGGEDGGVSLWDARTGELRLRFEGHQKQVMAVTFARDGRTLATGSHDRTVRLWDARDGRLKSRWECDASVLALAFAPEGDVLYCGEPAVVRARDVATGAGGASGTSHRNWVFSLSLSRDGRTLATGSHDGTVRLWDAVGMREVLVLPTNAGEVKCVTLAPNGNALAAIGIDGRIRVWR